MATVHSRGSPTDGVARIGPSVFDLQLEEHRRAMSRIVGDRERNNTYCTSKQLGYRLSTC